MLRQHSEGTVYAEFIVAFTPFLLLFLGGVQLALIAQARIVVQHAATRAARAAVVSIDDDPIFYEDGTRKVLSAEGSGEGHDAAQQLVAQQSGAKTTSTKSTGSGRLNRVRNAAYLPLSVLGPSHDQVLGWLGGALQTSPRQTSVAEAIGASPLSRVLTSLALYGRVASAVTFPEAAHGTELRDPEQRWGDAESVHVRVTYLFPCGIPLVRSIACDSLLGMKAAQLSGSLGKSKTDDAHEQALKELGHAEWASMQYGLYALVHERFVVLRGEASLPNQGAPYRYASELCKTKATAPGTSCKGPK